MKLKTIDIHFVLFSILAMTISAIKKLSARVEKVYKVVNKMTGVLGGNGYTGSIYGELTMHSMQKILELLAEKCFLTKNSRFIDIGSGIGKPNFHVAQFPGVQLSIGVELEKIRWQVTLITKHSLFLLTSAYLFSCLCTTC
jgi:hypothetical protein